MVGGPIVFMGKPAKVMPSAKEAMASWAIGPWLFFWEKILVGCIFLMRGWRR
jgi:hypothetical protein